MALTDRDQTILNLNQAMLESVARGDWNTYASFCSDDLSCFEAETNGILAEGLPFHRYYFELPGDGSPFEKISDYNTLGIGHGTHGP